MYDITIKRGDTRHAIKAVLKDASGALVDLTECEVKVHMAPWIYKHPGRRRFRIGGDTIGLQY